MAILMSTLDIPSFYRRSKRHPYIIPICLLTWHYDSLTLSGSKYPYLEHISMVPKMFEPLRFDCTCLISPQNHKLRVLIRSAHSHQTHMLWLLITAALLISIHNIFFWEMRRNINTFLYLELRGIQFYKDGLTHSVLHTLTYTCANSADPDETARNEPSHQDLLCLPFCLWC